MDRSEFLHGLFHGRLVDAAQSPLPGHGGLGHGPVGQAQGTDHQLGTVGRHVQAKGRHVLLRHQQLTAPLPKLVQELMVQRLIEPGFHQAAV